MQWSLEETHHELLDNVSNEEMPKHLILNSLFSSRSILIMLLK